MNFYNDIDPYCCTWTRELANAGEIPDGDVVCKSVTEITPDELAPYIQCHFFNGIAGWAYALRLAGWPEAKKVWCASLPCQPFSTAGKQLGVADPRHLWPGFFGLVKACRPEFIFGEQVAAAVRHHWLDGVFADLEEEGYTCGAVVLGAHSAGAPHIRQRIYWVAHARRQRDELGGGTCDVSSETSDVKVEAQQRQRSGDATANCGAVGGLADDQSQGWHGMESKREMEQRERSRVGWGGSTGGLGDTQGHSERRQWQSGAELRREGAAGGPSSRGPNSGMVLPGESGLEGLAGHGDEGYQPGRLGTDTSGPVTASGAAWSNFDLLPCRDGKFRRVESGTFPLAHGVPNRVGLLRGYGNAIVPEVAAMFVQEVMAEFDL